MTPHLATYIPHLDRHIHHKSGRSKTVCTSASLAFFGIRPDQYHYSGHMDEEAAILRRFGYSVRSRKSMFKVKSKPTLGAVRRQLAHGKGEAGGHYMLTVNKGKTFHRIVLSHHGYIVVDTAPGWTTNRCRVLDIRKVSRA